MGLIKLAIDRQNKELVEFNGSAVTLPPLYQTNTQPFRIQVVDSTGDPGTPYVAVDCTGLSLRVVITGVVTGGNDTLLAGTLEADWSYDAVNDWFTGSVDFNTAEISTFIGANAYKAAFLEINLMDGGSPTTLFGAKSGATNAIINANGDDLLGTAPAPSDTYLTEAQTEALWLSGAGSPEGVKTAGVGRTYWDTTGKILWIKDSGTGNTGWYQLVG